MACCSQQGCTKADDSAFDIPEKFLADGVIDVCKNRQVLKLITQEGDASKGSPPKGSRVVMHYTGTLTNGKQFDSSRTRGQPFETEIGEGMVIKGWDVAVPTMHIGERAEVLIQSEYGYGERGAGSDIPPNAALIFDMELLSYTKPEVISDEPSNDVPEEFTQDGVVDVCGNGQVLKLITKEGDGAPPADGTTATLHYCGYLTNGTKFDSSRDRGDTFDTQVGKGQVIKGWDAVMPTMKVNERAKVLIQSEYAYGKRGSPPKIKPNAALIFDMEMVGVTGEDLSAEKDKSFTKLVLKKSELFSSPDVQDTVKISLEKNGTLVYDELEYILGEEELHENIDMSITHCVLKLVPGEKSKFDLTAAAKENVTGEKVTYTIELISVDDIPRYWNMSADQKVEFGEKYKVKGSEFLKQGHLDAACKKYEYVLSITDNDIKERKEDLTSIRKAAMLNMALAKLKLKDYLQAIQACGDVLEIDELNEKAWFRKAEAQFQLKELPEALKSYKKVLTIAPDNKAAKRGLALTKKHYKEAQEAERKLAAKMFGL